MTPIASSPGNALKIVVVPFGVSVIVVASPLVTLPLVSPPPVRLSAPVRPAAPIE